ncbi:MAG: trypsin-like peptidase domain-containing protein [Bryobacterales bacterium]|nr:trypsin-like peptidase domain-containing protein [Bryobacterales bacterium]
MTTIRLLSPALLVCVLQAQSRVPAAAQLSQSLEQVADRVSPAVVQIMASGFAPDSESGSRLVRLQRSSGSGVIVDPEGFVITNAHVVGLSRQVQVLVPLPAARLAESKSVIKPTGKLTTAQVVGLDRETDIAVLRIEEKGLAWLPFGDSEHLRKGQIVLAFGSPFGLENSMTLGIVSSVARQLRPDHPMIYIQTDASINPGNSGGPLVDTAGAIVGINTFLLSESGASAGVGFAAPSNIVRNVYQQVRKHGRVRRGQIGIQAQTITPELSRALGLERDWGVIVGDVAPGSSAEAAGIEVRDILLTLNGKTLENARQFGVNIYQRAGETVTLELLRNGKKLTLQAAVLERPRDTDQVLALMNRDGRPVPALGVLAVDLNEKITPLLPPLRKLSGVVVTGVLNDAAGGPDSFFPGDVIYAVNDTGTGSLAELEAGLSSARPGDPVAVQIERLGQLQYLVIRIP